MLKHIIIALSVFLIAVVTIPGALSAKSERKVTLPENGDNQHVVSLGYKKDPQTGALVQGFAFIHRREAEVKGGNARAPKGLACYTFLASGARWKITENYIFDPTNTRSLNTDGLRTLLSGSTETWDSEVAFDVFGNEIVDVVDGAEIASPDGKNEVFFAAIDSPGAIAVTTVWGIFGGPLQNRKLVEWDMVFDDVDFDWSAETSGVLGKMDFSNIAVHEIGHAAGMGHPSSTCTEETMYAYADYGEIKKRDLNTGDVAGVKALYK